MRRSLLLLIGASFLMQGLPGNLSWRGSLSAAGQTVSGSPTQPDPPEFAFPLKPKSVRFAVVGDNGTGKPRQYEVARRMVLYRDKFPFDFVIMLGDNIYGGGGESADFKRKFEEPYKPLLEAGVVFYAALGNHDPANERYYKHFNMDGRRYYHVEKGDVDFFALDSNDMDRWQLSWLEQQLQSSTARWKICFFHHPIYSDGRTHGSDLDLRAQLEPLFVKYRVNVSFAGHDHVYERFKPQHSVYHFVMGISGQLRMHDLGPSAEMAAGFDTDCAFMVVEIAEDAFYFQTVSRKGEIVDQGVLQR